MWLYDIDCRLFYIYHMKTVFVSIATTLTIWSTKILRLYSLVDTLHHFIIIITQKCLRALNLQCASQIAKFMGPTWGPPGSFRPQMGPMMAPWTLLSGLLNISCRRWIIFSLLTCMQYRGPCVFSWSVSLLMSVYCEWLYSIFSS